MNRSCHETWLLPLKLHGSEKQQRLNYTFSKQLQNGIRMCKYWTRYCWQKYFVHFCAFFPNQLLGGGGGREGSQCTPSLPIRLLNLSSLQTRPHLSYQEAGKYVRVSGQTIARHLTEYQANCRRSIMVSPLHWMKPDNLQTPQNLQQTSNSIECGSTRCIVQLAKSSGDTWPWFSLGWWRAFLIFSQSPHPVSNLGGNMHT